MTEIGPSAVVTEAPPHGGDAGTAIEVLRARGAERFDPPGFRFIEALARRVTAQPDATAQVIERRLARALAEFGERFARAAADATATLAHATARFPHAAAVLEQYRAAGDFRGLRRHVEALALAAGGSPLAELLAHIRHHLPEGRDGAPASTGTGGAAARGELKSMRYFRSTWSRLSTDRQLSEALAQAPENAGPLNSHFLVLQALTTMRDISPDYLAQFMSYVDTLQWLEQAEGARSAAQKGAGRGERDKKRKAGRGKG